MSYPGNATLTQEMQERILSTFKQTLVAAAAGNHQEAKLGCDFILRLDSLFGPARELLDRMETAEGPVMTDDLAALIGVTPEEAPAADAAAADAPAAVSPPAGDPATDTAAASPALSPDIDDLSDLDLEMGLSDPVAPEPTAETAAAEPPPPPPPAPSPEPSAAAPPAQPAEDPPPVDLPDALDPGADPVGEPEPAVDSTPVEPPTPAAPEPVPQTPESEPSATEPPPVEAPPEPELPETAKAEPSPATEATETEAVAAAEPAGPSELDELDDLDLSVGAEAPAEPPPPAAEEVAEEEAPAPEAEPAAPEPEAKPEPEAEPASPEPETQPAASAPEAVEIPLGTEPAAQLDSESQQRVDDLLAEGQEAFDEGEYQGAIDAWSRIFLIDIDHAEANRRIEEARKLKAEADRKVEEKFHEGLAHLEGGDNDAAADSFRTVLEMQPSHLAARDYLEKLEAGEVPVPTELARPAGPEAAEDEVEAPGLDEPDEPDEDPKPKPDRGTKAVGDRMVSVKKNPFKSKVFLAIAGAGLIAVLGGAWYLFNNWSSLFPNSAQEQPARTVSDPLARAKGLHAEGKAPIAIAQLRRLPPDSPQYDEAQALIAQWELEQAPVDLGPEGPSPEELARREGLIAEAGSAAERREFMRSAELLSEAANIAPISGAETQLLARADEELQELQRFITLFREGEWDLALRDLWLLRESDPGNRDVTRLLADSYYNLGLRSLQRKDVKVASEQFQEALGLTPDDPELLRLADFAATYQTRPDDLLYRIYVKYHPFR